MDKDRANAAFQAFLECTGHTYVSTAWLDIPSYHATTPYCAPKVHGPYPSGYPIKRILTVGKFAVDVPDGAKAATDPLYRELVACGVYPLAIVKRHEARETQMFIVQFRVYVIEKVWQEMRVSL